MSALPLLGHERVRRQLADAADRDGLHHAYLFEGPSGLGKRAVAEWFARYVNCEAAADRPCGRCGRCVRILAGTHPDVIRLEPPADRASGTIAVDAVRELIRQSGYHRFDSARRVVIVDPAEALQESAANALLKTLEEPPEGTGFVLIASSASALLPTVVSRCQRVRFGAIATEAIAAWLTDAGEADANLAAAASLGCPGRALALARGGLAERAAARDEVIALTTGTLAAFLAHTEKLTKASDAPEHVARLLRLVEELLRDVVVHAAGGRAPLLHADAQAVVARWAAALVPDGVERVERALDDARSQLRVQVNRRVVLEALFATLRAELHPG